jgi:deazaflavin-dependent oxidoreductase (nitroreductase family)
MSRLVRSLAATAPAAWALGRVLRYLDRLMLRISGGRVTLTSLLAGVPVVMVTTTGAHSGQQRTSPLLPIRADGDRDCFALVASNWGQHRTPAWYFNLRANARAVCTVGQETGSYRAHEASEEEYERFWKAATELYAGYVQYRQRAGRRIPIMVMERIRDVER